MIKNKLYFCLRQEQNVTSNKRGFYSIVSSQCHLQELGLDQIL